MAPRTRRQVWGDSDSRRAENSGLLEAGAGGGAGQGGIWLHFVTTCTCVEKNLDG